MTFFGERENTARALSCIITGYTFSKTLLTHFAREKEEWEGKERGSDDERGRDVERESEREREGGRASFDVQDILECQTLG